MQARWQENDEQCIVSWLFTHLSLSDLPRSLQQILWIAHSKVKTPVVSCILILSKSHELEQVKF